MACNRFAALALAVMVCSTFAARDAAGQSSGQIVVRPATLIDFGGERPSCDQPLTAVTPTQTITITFDGTPSEWVAVPDQPWVKIVNGWAAANGQFTISIVNSSNLPCQMFSFANVSIVANGASNSPAQIRVALGQDLGGDPGDPPFGQIDSPAQNATGVNGALAVTGWALDRVAVDTIKVYRPCFSFDDQAACETIDGESLVYLTDAVFIAGARPDIEEAYPGWSLNYRAGWGVEILTNMLPHLPKWQAIGGEGTMPLYVYATSVRGFRTRLGRSVNDTTPTTVTLDNDHLASPFGTIDTPRAGDTVSGLLPVFGWALTPDGQSQSQSGQGPIDVSSRASSVTFYVDGAVVGGVAYGQCRGDVGNPPPASSYCDDDVSNLFGNAAPAAPLSPRSSNPTVFRNLDAGRGAIGSVVLDTTTLTNGPHTMSWVVTDSAGRSTGVGSRFFTVLNSGGSSVGMVQASATPAAGASRPAAAGMTVTTGFASSTKTASAQAAPSPSGIWSATIPASGRVAITLPAAVASAYLVVNGARRDLPVGSHLDTAAHAFTWSPPPGFKGTYRFEFAGAGGSSSQFVDVTVK